MNIDKFLWFICVLILFIGAMNIYETTDLERADFGLFCKASDGYLEGKNPYDIQEIEVNQPYRYPPMILYMFMLFCKYDMYFIYSILLVLIVLAIHFADKEFQLFLFLPLLIVGLNGMYYSFGNGQLGILDALFISIIFLCISRKWYYTGGFFFGLMSVIKTVPIVYTVLILFLNVSMKKRIKMILVSIYTYIGFHILNYIVLSSTYEQYVKFTFSGIYPFVDRMNLINPSLLTVVHRNYLIYIGIVILFIIIYLWNVLKFKNEIKRLSIGILWVMLTLPEMKWYTFVIGTIPIYFLIKDLPNNRKFWYLILVCIIPVICKMLIVTYNLESILMYYQYYVLLGITLALTIDKGTKS